MSEPENLSVPIVWVGLDDEPVVMANQFLGQVLQDEIILSFGSMVQPPILPGTEEQRREQFMQITHVPVGTVVRMTMTRRRVEELMTMLRDTLAIYDGRYGSDVAGGGE